MTRIRPLLPLLVLASLAPAQRAPDAASIQALIEHAFEVFQPVGLAVAVVDRDQVVLELGLGERVKGSGEPITPSTQFNIASCTKAFTAACVGKLVDEGKLGWDDLVVDHLPEFRLSDPWITAHFTVRDLLCHRSGLKTFAGDLLWYGTDYDDAQVLARMARLPITQRFREQFGYQNLMYMVAGLLVERVSGASWASYLRDAILAPLGMDGTATGLAALPAGAEPAQPHVDGERIGPVEFQACKPAGAIWSSVDDMTHWIRMLLANGTWDGRPVLSAATIHACWSPHTVMGGGRAPAAIEDFNSYGLGWFVGVQDGKKLVEHDGGMPGYISKVTLIPADGFGLVVLNNGMDGLVNLALRRAILAQRNGEDGRALIDRLGAVASARAQRAKESVARREAARLAGTTASLPLERYAGRYEDAVLGSAEVTWDGSGLRLVVLPAAKSLCGALSHWHQDVFRVDFPDRFLPFALIRFSLDVRGEVDGFRIDCPIDDFDFGALDFRRTAPR